jgi:hypothetical protein
MMGALGMWWFDDNPKTPRADKVKAAADAFERRTGRKATTCWVNPAEVEGLTVKGMEIIGSRNVDHNCYYAGERG